MVYNNILEAIGHTPMIRLNRMNKPGNAEIYLLNLRVLTSVVR